jgi:hypothetical protein
MRLEEDQEGLGYLRIVRRFFTEVIDFAALRPARGGRQGAL